MENVLNKNVGGVAGGRVCENYPIPCKRCKGTFFHICRDGDDYIAFCGNDKCLKEDSEASKAIDRNERQKAQERNQHGQIMTGAEKYNMGSDYKHACLAKWFASKEAHQTVSDWLKNYSPFLTIIGSTGTGKTYVSASILNMLFEKKEDIFYTTHRRFIEEIQKGINEGRSQHYEIDKLCRYKFLILDDLGSSRCTDWQVEMILELIDRRYSDNMKTLITSNLNKNEIKDVLGERTFSRVFDHRNSQLAFWKEDRRINPDTND